ncbi:MAG: choice-of-anchor V domain-containing protein [Saprospiraceae bacterium]
MNKKLYPIIIALSSFILLSNVNNPPNGNTGAPGDGICSNCHTGSSGGLDGTVTISGLPTMVDVNTTYTITVTVENLTTASKGGFQLVTLDQSNNDVGTLSSPGPSSTIQSGGSRFYFEHNPALSFAGPGTVSYNVNWKSPATASGQTIKMYAASVLSNGNGSSSGDLIKTDQVSGTMPGPPPLSGVISSFLNLKCNNGFDGSISVSAFNGVPPYTYQWSDGQTTATATGLSAKMYSVTITDNISATVVLSKLLTEPPAINMVTTGKRTLSCNGDKDGNITVNSSGGTGGHQYKWNTGSNVKNITNLIAGDYTVTITDANNCTVSHVISVTQPDAITIEFKSIQYPVCKKDSTGSFNVEIEGGIAPYFYKWSSSETGFSIKNKRTGTYTVTITDKNNCTKSNSITLIVKDTIRPVFNHWKDTTSYRCNLVATAPMATDNCGIKEIQTLEGIMPGDTFPIGTTKMKYRAIDENNNSTDYSYIVNVIFPLKLKVDTTVYDTCSGKINLLQITMSNKTNEFYDLYFGNAKFKRYDTSFVLKKLTHEFKNDHLFLKDSFGCVVDTLLKFDTTQANFILDSFKVKDASECKINDGEIKLYLKGNVVSSFWLNEKGDTIINSTGKGLAAGKYFFYASSGMKNDTDACVLSFGPFEIKCTTESNNIISEDIQIYPNPAQDQLYFNTKSNESLIINIFNLQGKLVLNKRNYNSNGPLELLNLSNGVYLIELESNGNKQRHRFIVAK